MVKVIHSKRALTPKSQNISEWYNDVVLHAELADYAPVKGCMVIRPHGYAIWEGIQRFMDRLIKEHGVENAYFPLFIPESYLAKEKEHVEGFSPQVAVVTYAGGEELKEKLVVRPTSETIMYELFKRWTHSYRDLPVLINQWCNIVRWEKRTYLFLRTSEFLWQEGHCAHATHSENYETVLWAIRMYEQTYQELLCLYGIVGKKSESEKFPGAIQTLTYEMLMPDGKVLQGCTSHDLGQNFAKAIGWEVQNKDGGKLQPYQNSWGFSTRSIGGLILSHGDDRGLVLPPNIAPVQIAIVPIPGSSENVYEYARMIYRVLGFIQKIDLDITTHRPTIKDLNLPSVFRVVLDEKVGETAGFKFNKWELKGVPLRIEVGEKEATENQVTLVTRDTGEKITGSKEKILRSVPDILSSIQNNLFAKHKKFTVDNTHEVTSYDEFKQIMDTSRGFLLAFWCEDPVCEAKIKAETKASTRVLPLDAKEESGKCIYCRKQAKHRWYFAQAY